MWKFNNKKITENVTVLIKTFERPQLLIRLYRSIRKFYPELKIIIVDDSKNIYDKSSFDNQVEYYHMEYDIGLSAGRNYGLKKVKTKYFLLLDDDFVFTQKTKIEKMYKVLESTDFSIVGGEMLNFGKEHSIFYGIYELRNNVLYRYVGKSRGKHKGYKVYDVIINFFMADTKKIQEILWDERLKMCEHEDFFLRLKERKLLVTTLGKKVLIDHFPQVKDKMEQYYDRIKYWNIVYRKFDFKEFKKIAPRIGFIKKIHRKLINII